MGNENLTDLRGRIDAIDDQIAQLVQKRIELSNLIMTSKPSGQIVDPQREQAIIQRYSKRLEDVSTAPKSKKLALAIIGASALYPGPTSRVLALNHADVIIPRNAEPQAREFYCDFLGLKEIEKPKDLQKNGGLWLELGDAQVHMSIQDGYDPSKTKAHLAYEVSDLQALRSALEERGFVWKDNTPIPGFVRGDIRDPFGNRIEFLQRI